MTLLTRVATIVALWCVVSPAAARPMPLDHVKCAFDVYTPVLVMPFALEEEFGSGVSRRLHGARVFVAAKPGLTERGLMIRLHREMSSPLAERCRPDVRQLDVSVFAGEGGFWVELSASGERSAASVLRWAQRGLFAAHDSTSAAR
jgi:hypothetical protein